MFDFAFSELLVICVVALVVLGPTRLPGLVRKVGRWVGKARAMARDFREQLENEVNLDELSRATRQPPPAPAAQQEESAASNSPASPTAPVPATPPGATPSGSPPEYPEFSAYPYGTPTDMTPTNTSSSSADPAVVQDGPQPGDDDYSHAHAPGAAPEPWNPEPEPEPEHLAATEPGTESGKPAA